MDTPDASSSEPAERTVLGRGARWALGAFLLLAFFGSIGWIVLRWPLPIRLWVALALVAGAAATGFIGLFIRSDLPAHWRRALAGGSALTLGIAAVMAVPALQGETAGTRPITEASGPAADKTSSTAEPSADSESDPFTAVLKFDNYVTPCENYTVSKSLLSSLPEVDYDSQTGIDAEWIYEKGGVTLSEPELTIQGKTADAVIIRGLRVVDLERNEPPTDAVGVLPCGGTGGDMDPRSFDVVMGDQPKIKPRLPKGSPELEGVDVDLPIKVSNSDPEIFYFRATGPDCFCHWRLAIDWSSGDREGTTVVDHGFGAIRSDTATYQGRDMYEFEDGKWQP